MVGQTRQRRRFFLGLVVFGSSLFNALCVFGQTETASVEITPDRVVQGQRFVLRIQTNLLWREDISIEQPELKKPLVWWAKPYARPWTDVSESGENIRKVEVLSSIRVNASGFFTVDSFRILAGGQVSVTEPMSVIGLNSDEKGKRYPVYSSWRTIPRKVWQGQAFPIVLEAQNLASLILNEPVVLKSPIKGFLEETSQIGEIKTHRYKGTLLYDIPVGSWIWTLNEVGTYAFPPANFVIDGLNRAAPIFSVEVLPLPEAARNSGAVGYFNVKTEWEREPHNVEDLVNIRVRVEGKGNLNVLKIPIPNIENSELIGRQASSSYQPSVDGYEGWREESFNFQMKKVGEQNIVIPEWTWIEPRGTVRRVSRFSETIQIMDAGIVTDSENQLNLLGSNLFRYGRTRIHGKNNFLYLLCLPGLLFSFGYSFLKKRRFSMVAGALVLPFLLSMSGMNQPDKENAARAATLAQNGNTEEAEKLYSEIGARIGEHPGLLHDMAILETKKKSPDSAVLMIRRALQLRPGTQPFIRTMKKIEEQFGLSDQSRQPLQWSVSMTFLIWMTALNLLSLTAVHLLHKQETRNVILFITILIVAIAAGALEFFTEKSWKQVTAVVLENAEPLRKIPSPLATDWIHLSEGSVIRVKAVEKEYCFVLTNYGLEGWIPSSSLGFTREAYDGF